MSSSRQQPAPAVGLRPSSAEAAPDSGAVPRPRVRSQEPALSGFGLVRDPDRGVLLLVEDDPDHAFLVQKRLREYGLPLPVEHLVSASAAAARVRSGGVACAVLDLSLPDARDLAAVALLRDADPFLPVVVLTGLDSREKGLEALRLGAQDYLVKGATGHEGLGRAVVYAMERVQLQRAKQEAARTGRLLELVLDTATDGVCWLDQRGRCTYVNRAAAHLLGRDQHEQPGFDLHAAVHPRCAGGCPLDTALESRTPAEVGLQVLEPPGRPTLQAVVIVVP